MRCQSDLSSADLRWRRDVGCGGDAGAFRNERGDEIETVQDQLANRTLAHVHVEAGNRAMGHLVLAIDLQYLFLGEAFDDVAHAEHDDRVCYHENALAMVLPGHHLEGASQP